MQNILLVALMLPRSSPASIYQQPSGIAMKATIADGSTLDWTTQKTPSVHMFVGPSPDQYEKAIKGNKEILRARIMLDSSTTVEFYERPKDFDYYGSTIVLNRIGEPSRTYNVGTLIKHQALSLAHVGIVRSGVDTGMLICEYEGGAVGAREGFAILRFSQDSFELHTLPLTDFGKVVVFRSKPDLSTIWSALPYPRGSDAEPMAYTTQVCRWQGNGYACDPPKRKRGRFSPAAINEPGIEIR